jgi:hypothetical protein
MAKELNGQVAIVTGAGRDFVFTALAEQTMTSPDAQRWLPGMIQRLQDRKAVAGGDRDLARCAQRCVDLASGRYDALSGNYMELDDDLDAWPAGKPPADRSPIQPRGPDGPPG